MKFKNPARTAILLTFGALAFVATTVGAQRAAAPGQQDGETAQLVSSLVSRKHISHAPIDDKISERLLNRYLETLDPLKLYFTRADVDRLQQRRHLLDDDLRAGNVQFAHDTFQLYKDRLASRINLAHELIDTNHDFDLDEEMIVDADDLPWAPDDAEIRERWRKRIKFDLISLRLAAEDDKEDSKTDDDLTPNEQLHKRYNTILKTMRQTESFEVLEMYLSSLTHCFDPHSSYMSPQTLEDFRISMQLSLEGIGAALRSEDGYTIVAQIVAGGAADEDGRLEVDDKIIAVDSKANGEWTDVVEMKLSKVVRYIRGPKGTRVALRVRKAATGETVVYDLQRKKIELKSAEVKGEIIDTLDRTGRAGRIGVLNIPSFYRDFKGAQLGIDFKSTKKDVQKVLTEFNQQGPLDAVIVDLRYNGGGALSEAIEVTGLFLSQGPVVQVKEQNGVIKSHADEDPATWYRGPLIVLCNRMSASASEIFAGAIKDYGRGIVIGDTTTHGKGTVQNVMPVTNRLRLFNQQDRGALKLTINQFYRVNGDSTQKKGVESDVVLPSILDHRDVGEDALDNALPFDQIGAAPGRQVSPYRPRNVISSLVDRSKGRVSQNGEFQELEDDIAKFLERKNRKTISLNENTLRREQEEAKREREEAKKAVEEETKDEDAPIFAPGFYNDEVVEITLDYVELLKQVRTVRSN